MSETTTSRTHSFFATAFVENLPLKELVGTYAEAKRSPRELWFQPASGGTVFIYPFGAVVFFDVAPEVRASELRRLRLARPGLTKAQVLNEELSVRETPNARPDVDNGLARRRADLRPARRRAAGSRAGSPAARPEDQNREISVCRAGQSAGHW